MNKNTNAVLNMLKIMEALISTYKRPIIKIFVSNYSLSLYLRLFTIGSKL